MPKTYPSSHFLGLARTTRHFLSDMLFCIASTCDELDKQVPDLTLRHFNLHAVVVGAILQF